MSAFVCVHQVIGKVGTVVGITESGDLKVRYSSENILCNICAEAVVKVREYVMQVNHGTTTCSVNI